MAGMHDHHSMDHLHGQHHNHSMNHDIMNHDAMNHNDHPMNGSHEHMPSNGDHSGHHEHSMLMYFHSSIHSTILFSFWKTDSILTMLVSCLAIIVLGTLYEGLKVLREKLLLRNGCCDSNLCNPRQVPAVASSSFGDGDNNCCAKEEPLVHTSNKMAVKNSMCNKYHVIQTLLHGLQICISYFLMLIFMTYNVWPCISVIIGAMLGFFLFSWKRHKCAGCVPTSNFVISDHCH